MLITVMFIAAVVAMLAVVAVQRFRFTSKTIQSYQKNLVRDMRKEELDRLMDKPSEFAVALLRSRVQPCLSDLANWGAGCSNTDWREFSLIPPNGREELTPRRYNRNGVVCEEVNANCFIAARTFYRLSGGFITWRFVIAQDVLNQGEENTVGTRAFNSQSRTSAVMNLDDIKPDCNGILSSVETGRDLDFIKAMNCRSPNIPRCPDGSVTKGYASTANYRDELGRVVPIGSPDCRKFRLRWDVNHFLPADNSGWYAAGRMPACPVSSAWQMTGTECNRLWDSCDIIRTVRTQIPNVYGLSSPQACTNNVPVDNWICQAASSCGSHSSCRRYETRTYDCNCRTVNGVRTCSTCSYPYCAEYQCDWWRSSTSSVGARYARCESQSRPVNFEPIEYEFRYAIRMRCNWGQPDLSRTVRRYPNYGATCTHDWCP
jgi:hypothetical protein